MKSEELICPQGSSWRKIASLTMSPPVKYFLGVLIRAFRRERHFALVEGLPYQPKARLVGCAVAATEVGMVIATQRAAPAHLVRGALGRPNLLTAQLENDSDNRIVSHRIGWLNVRPYGIELRKGVLISVRGRIKPGDIRDIADQAVSFDESAQSVIFFVAELTFADGSVWNVDIEDIAHEAGLEFSR
jgi:hypothetical protein